MNNIIGTPGKDRKMRHVIYSLILFLVAIALYSPTINFDFTLDDPAVTTLNDEVKNIRGGYFRFFTTSHYAGTQVEQGNRNLYRPLVKASMAFNYKISDGQFNPRHFHIMNVILYGLCVVIVYYLFISIRKPDDHSIGVPFCIALLFTVFPSHIESVSNIKHREEIMACLFGLLAWLMVAQKPKVMSFRHFAVTLAASLFFLLSLFSKESAVLLFPCIVTLEFINNKLKFRNIRNYPLYFYTFAAAVLLYFIFRYNALGTLFSPQGTSTFFKPNEHLITRFLISSRIYIKYYLWDQLIALKLNPSFSSRFLVFGDDHPIVYDIGAALLILSLLFAALWRVYKNRSVLSYWILFFFVTSFLTANIIPIGTVGAFRLVFTPSLALCVIIVLLFKIFAYAIGNRLEISGKQTEVIFAALIIALTIYYANASYTKMGIWRNNTALFSYASALEPGDPMSPMSAGQAYEQRYDNEMKYVYYEKSLENFMAREAQPYIFDARSIDQYSVVATEIAFKNVQYNPERAIKLGDLAIEQFVRLKEIRGGKMNTNATAPYYVKALALKNLGRIQESIKTCIDGLAIDYHRGLEQLLSTMTSK